MQVDYIHTQWSPKPKAINYQRRRFPWRYYNVNHRKTYTKAEEELHLRWSGRMQRKEGKDTTGSR